MLNQYKYSIPKEAIGNTLIKLAKENNKICNHRLEQKIQELRTELTTKI
jgi:hypothetical protein